MPIDQVGVEEVYVHVDDEAVRSTFSAIKRKIINIHTGDKAPKLIHPALVLFSSEKYMEEFFFDIKLYMESCVICSNSDVEAFLINDDHRFFCFFLRSPIVEEFLQCGVNEVLDCGCTIPIKLAGEVIPGV